MGNFREGTYAICVGRSYGSGGLEFAHALSKRLGIPLYDKNILDQAAQNSNIRKELFERADEQATFSIPLVYGAGFAPTSSFFVYSDNVLSNENLFTIQSETIEKLAEKGSAIFVGRAADFILKEHPHLLTLFVTDDEDVRVKEIQKRLEIKEEREAYRELEKIDKIRREYYNFYTSHRWGRAENYDVTLKLSRFGIDYAVELVVDLLRHRGFLAVEPKELGGRLF